MHLRRSFGVLVLALLAGAASVPSAFAQASTPAKASAPVSGSTSGVTSVTEESVTRSISEVMAHFESLQVTMDFIDKQENVVDQRVLHFNWVDGVPQVSERVGEDIILLTTLSAVFEGNTLKIMSVGFGSEPQITTFSVSPDNQLIVQTQDIHGSGNVGFSVSTENGAVTAQAACVCFPSNIVCAPTDCDVSMECLIGGFEYHCRHKYDDAGSIGDVRVVVTLR